MCVCEAPPPSTIFCHFLPSKMRSAFVLANIIAIASAQPSTDSQHSEFSIGEPSPAGLTGCQICSRPGGDCSKASHGNPGIPCGDVDGIDYCCPSNARCWACKQAYRCYTGSRPTSQICVNSGGNAGGSISTSYYDRRGGYGLADRMVSSAVGFICILFLFSAVLACFRTRRATPLMHTQQVVEMNAVPMGCAATAHGVPTAVAVGRPCGQAGGASGLPVAQAVACPQQVAVGTRPGVAHVHHHHGGYGGYGGSSVAMNAGMGVSLRDASSHTQQCGSRAASAFGP